MNPGPMARWNEIKGEEGTMSKIVQRVTDGETLKQIAKSWDVPYGKLSEWIVEDRERSEQYNQALRIWADNLAVETVQIADDVAEERDAIAKAKLKTVVRMGLAEKLNRERYGHATEIKHTGSLSLVAVLAGLPRSGAVIENEIPPALDAGKVEVIGPVTAAEKIPEKIAEKADLLI